MTPGSTRKDLSFSNSNRRSRSRRVSTIHRSMNSNQLNPRKISFGKTRRRLSFNKSLDKRKKKKKINWGPARRVKRPGKFNGSKSPWKKY